MGVKISELGAAEAPLTGTELLEVTQDGLSRRATAAQVAGLASTPDASFVTLGTNPNLPSERVLTAGSGISLVDDGPGSTVTISASGVMDQGTFTSNNAIDLVDTDVALRIGAVNPNSSPHMEINQQFIQAKADLASVAPLFLNRLGGDVSIGDLSGMRVRVEDGANVTIRHAGVDVAQSTTASAGGLMVNNQDTGAGLERVLTTGDLAAGSISALYFGTDPKIIAQEIGGIVRGSSSFDGDPTTGGDQDATLDFQNFSGDLVGSIIYEEVPDMTVINYVEDGRIELWGTTSVGAAPMIVADPFRSVTLYDSGARCAEFRLDGVDLIGSSGGAPSSGSAQESYVAFTNDAQEIVGEVGFSSTEDLELTNYNYGTLLVLQGTDAGGTLRSLFVGDPDGSADLYYDGLVRLGTVANGAQIYAANSPGIGSSQTVETTLSQANGVVVGRVGFLTTVDLHVRNVNHSGRVILGAENSGGVVQNLLIGDPDGSVVLYNLNNQRLETTINGISVRGDTATGIGTNQSSRILLEDSSGVVIGRVAFASSANLEVRSFNHGGSVVLMSEDTGGTNRTLFDGDPDGAAGLYNAGTLVARTAAAASGGLEANNADTGGGFERVLTTSDLSDARVASAAKTASTVRDSTATLADDPHLVVDSLVAASYFRVEVFLMFSDMGSGGFRWDINVSAGTEAATTRWSQVGGTTGLTATVVGQTTGATLIATADAPATTRAINIVYTFRLISSGDPTFTFQWAQETSNAAGITMLQASHMVVTSIN